MLNKENGHTTKPATTHLQRTHRADGQPDPPDVVGTRADRAFIIYGPLHLRDYGLHQSASRRGKEPSARPLERADLDLCRKEGVRIIFVQPNSCRRNMKSVPGRPGTQVVPINPLSYIAGGGDAGLWQASARNRIHHRN